MRSFNRAILADIIDKGLDPKVPHKVGADNRLERKEIVEEKEKEILEKIEEHQNTGEEKVEEISKDVVERPKKKSSRFKKKSQES